MEFIGAGSSQLQFLWRSGCQIGLGIDWSKPTHLCSLANVNILTGRNHDRSFSAVHILWLQVRNRPLLGAFGGQLGQLLFPGQLNHHGTDQLAIGLQLPGQIVLWKIFWCRFDDRFLEQVGLVTDERSELGRQVDSQRADTAVEDLVLEDCRVLDHTGLHIDHQSLGYGDLRRQPEGTQARRKGIRRKSKRQLVFYIGETTAA